MRKRFTVDPVTVQLGKYVFLLYVATAIVVWGRP